MAQEKNLEFLVASFFQQFEKLLFVHLLVVVSGLEVGDGIFVVVQFVGDVRAGDEEEIRAWRFDLHDGGRTSGCDLRAQFFGQVFEGKRLDAAC